MNNTTYIAVKTPGRRWSWDIVNAATGIVVEGGFFSREADEDYIWREYTPAT